MSFQPFELLLDISARRKQDGLLVQPALVQRTAGLQETVDLLLQPLPDSFRRARRHALYHCKECGNARDLLGENGPQPGALLGPRADQSIQGVMECGQHALCALPRLAFTFFGLHQLDEPFDVEQGFRCQRTNGNPRLQSLDRSEHLVQRLLVQAQFRLPLTTFDNQGDIDAAARYALVHSIPERRLKTFIARRNTCPNIEAAAVYRSDFPVPGEQARCAIRPGEPRHAFHGHGVRTTRAVTSEKQSLARIRC